MLVGGSCYDGDCWMDDVCWLVVVVMMVIVVMGGGRCDGKNEKNVFCVNGMMGVSKENSPTVR